MKKIRLMALPLLCVVLPLPSYAELLLGANTGIALNGKAEYEANGVTVSEDVDTSQLSVFIGHKNARNNRVLLSVESIRFESKANSDASETARGIRLDSEFVYLDSMIKPYWGVGFGFYENSDALENETLNGFSFQLKGGAKIELTKTVELDISAQSQAIAWQDVEVANGYSTTTVTPLYSHFTLNAGVALAF